MTRLDEGWQDGPVTKVEMQIRHAKAGWIWVDCRWPPVDVVEALSDGWGGLALGAETWGRDERTQQERHYRVSVDGESTRARDEARARREEERARRREIRKKLKA